MVYGLILTVHVFVCFVLILVILLQAGRGSGMSEMWGGGQPQSIFGTQTNFFMTRATEVCAVLFILTSLTLGIMTSHKGKSLVQKEMFSRDLKKNLMAPISKKAGVNAPTAPVSEKKEPAKEPVSEKKTESKN